VPPPTLRLRAPSPGLLALPWLEPLGEWDATEVPLRDIPVGPSRHLVRFVETDGRLWALKELPRRVAEKEYAVLRDLETRALPAVRPAGLVIQPQDDNAILVTRYLQRSWQYRRLLMRIPPDQPRHRERLLDAMASLLVDLHRNGVFWGDCSLANTLFSRDGQVLQAWLRRDQRDPSAAHRRPARPRYRHPGGERRGWAGRPRDAAGAAAGDVRRADRRGGRRRDPLPGAVGRPARRADVRVHRPVPGGGADPAAAARAPRTCG
jgi:hypothetical protein